MIVGIAGADMLIVLRGLKSKSNFSLQLSRYVYLFGKKSDFFSCFHVSATHFVKLITAPNKKKIETSGHLIYFFAF